MTTSKDVPVTLDYIDKITVLGNVFQEPANEYWALIYLRKGMKFLCLRARHCDQIAQRAVNPTGNGCFCGGGNCPAFDQVSKELLTCAFHWYAISACQYVRTVGAIAHQHDPSRPLANKYAMKIIPEVVAFRDKVAAHFAWLTENKKDNDAERSASILPSLIFENDSFHMGAFTVTERRSGKTSNSESIKPWSICRIHEQLRKRYWPLQQCDGHPPEGSVDS